MMLFYLASFAEINFYPEKRKSKCSCFIQLTEHVVSEVIEAVGRLSVGLGGLSILLQVQLQRLDVVVEAQRRHGEQDVLAVDGLPLFGLKIVAQMISNRKAIHVNVLDYSAGSAFENVRMEKEKDGKKEEKEN